MLVYIYDLFFHIEPASTRLYHRLRIILYIINQNYTQIFNIDLFEYLTIIYCNNLKLKSIWLQSSVFYII